MSNQFSPAVDTRPILVGDRFTDLYTGNVNRLVTQLYFVTGDVEEARDCVQEAFARAWVRWAKLQHEGIDPIAWVYQVGYRIAVSRWRRHQAGRRALRRLGVTPDVTAPSADAVAIATALAELPHGQRAVVVLHYYEGFPVAEIARRLDLTQSAVKSRLMRARQALDPLLREEEAHRA